MTYTMDDIDVFILAHERPGLLAETLDSVVRSTVLPAKITVLDNDSEQNLKQVVEKYAGYGVEYVRTTGRDGNYYKSKELASKKYILRLHDDNLIHPEFFEKMLFALNNINNLTAVTSNYTPFFTGSETSLPEQLPESYKNPNHLENEYLITTSPADYIKHIIKVNTYPYKGINVGGTPFLITETKLFKEYKTAYDKYAKADDLDFFVYLNSKGNIACLSDERAAYFRLHSVRDSASDENSLTFKQYENWVRLLTRYFQNETDEKTWLDIFEVIYAVWPNFMKKSVQNDYTPYRFLSHCYDVGILPEFSRKYFERVPDLETCFELKNIRIKKLSLSERIFSVTNEYSNGRVKKMLNILFLRLNLSKWGNKILGN